MIIYLTLLILSILSFFIVIKYKYLLKFYDYNSDQKTHTGYVPRLGGLLIICYFMIFLFFYNLNDGIVFLNYKILISGFLMFFLTLKEDLFGNTQPISRLIVIFLCSIFAVVNFDQLPDVDIFILSFFLENYIFEIIFYSLSLTILANGNNIIDGMNGLTSLSSISSLICLLTIGYNNNLNEVYFTILILLILLIIFLYFNFPNGKIFLGDSGAYWIGWITGILIIYIISNINYINPWIVLVIVFYPCFELFFSFFRKIIQSKSPFQADTYHLHLLIYKYFQNKHSESILNNSFITILMAPLWISNLFFIILFNFNFVSVGFIIIFQISIYLFYYILFLYLIKKTY